MITARDFDPTGSATRFKLFPQPPFGSPVEAETVWISSPAGSIGPGPSDARMYVVDPIGKLQPYGVARDPYMPFLYLPPWNGPIHPPAMPGPDGHFDHLEPGTAEFEAAHAYGCTQFVLDVWEGYFGRSIPWHFWRDYERLEISLFRDSDNAFAGYGYMELGAHVTETGFYWPFSLNFDVLAHEVGHLIIYSQVGLPDPDAIEGEYFGFHESAADLMALVAVLHFDSVVDQVLERSRGNLYTYNQLNRFAELSENQQIRLASNPVKLSQFVAGWSDEHDLSQPLTGALFDILVDIFHERLIERGLIGPEVEDLADRIEREPELADLMQSLFDDAYGRDPEGFRAALLDARGDLGTALAVTWSRLSPHFLNYEDVGDALLEVDREMSGGRYQRLILNNFRWRQIGFVSVGPQLAPSGESHALSARTLVPNHSHRFPRRSYHERWAISRGA